MPQTKEDFAESFPSIEKPVFKKEVYRSCVLYTIQQYDILKTKYNLDNFPSNKYYTIDDLKKSNSKKEKKTPKKRSPVQQHSDNDESSDEKKVESKPKIKKSYSISFNKNAKTIIDFIVARFLWEIYSIEAARPEDVNKIKEFILENVPKSFEYNITQLIINSVDIYKPSEKITDNTDVNKEMHDRFNENLNNNKLSKVATTYMIGFLKLICIFFANRFWLEKTQTVNIKIFETILRYIELSIPSECDTISGGLLFDIYKYDSIVNKTKRADKNLESDNEPDEEPEEPEEPVGEPEEPEEQEEGPVEKSKQKKGGKPGGKPSKLVEVSDKKSNKTKDKGKSSDIKNSENPKEEEKKTTGRRNDANKNKPDSSPNKQEKGKGKTPSKSSKSTKYKKGADSNESDDNLAEHYESSIENE